MGQMAYTLKQNKAKPDALSTYKIHVFHACFWRWGIQLHTPAYTFKQDRM